ncbi:MAG TPA: hypothetical protein VFQ49_07065 [Actinomycetes bacterium]|nr:hypothetical protein [Actinomycetes bacterium]
MGGVILLTGATGFLGTQVARRLLRAWWDWPELAHAVDGGVAPLAADSRGGRVTILAGDVRAPGLAWSRPPKTAEADHPRILRCGGAPIWWGCSMPWARGCSPTRLLSQ